MRGHLCQGIDEYLVCMEGGKRFWIMLDRRRTERIFDDMEFSI